MTDFSDVKKITIPQGEVAVLRDGQGRKIWQRLPAGYTEVEYLASTGTQYINTGYAFTAPDLAIECKYRKGNNLARNVFGVDTGGTSGRCMHGHIYNTSVYLGDRAVPDLTVPQSVGVDYTLRFSFSLARTPKAVWTVNGTDYTYNSVNGWVGTSFADYLFATNTQSTPTFLLTGRIYYYRMWNNTGTLVRDFVPAVRDSDSVAGMYDLVTKAFYTNSGTGTFVAGAEK